MTRALLTRLLDVTPLPPADAGVAELLATFEVAIAERAAILSEISPPITLSEMDRPLLIELERRQALWQDALASALRRVGEQRMATTQLRAYAGAG
ncbi:MAG: hypothetical protein E6J90_38650 [Deltaproteobacteria bacterium]|nr:MAG: hypothetical protein E6J90_38650 [Deltaproteobacteria bacterium]TMQ11326.1 MAG: hypothetical protein E6J91_23435 [Deltaproteobacteria bacterium]